MGRNFRRVDRGYQRSREKEQAQALVDEDFYEEELEAARAPAPDAADVSDLMASAPEPEQPAATEPAGPAPPTPVMFRERAPTGGPAATPTPGGLARSVRRLWNSLRRHGG